MTYSGLLRAYSVKAQPNSQPHRGPQGRQDSYARAVLTDNPSSQRGCGARWVRAGRRHCRGLVVEGAKPRLGEGGRGSSEAKNRRAKGVRGRDFVILVTAVPPPQAGGNMMAPRGVSSGCNLSASAAPRKGFLRQSDSGRVQALPAVCSLSKPCTTAGNKHFPKDLMPLQSDKRNPGLMDKQSTRPFGAHNSQGGLTFLFSDRISSPSPQLPF